MNPPPRILVIGEEATRARVASALAPLACEVIRDPAGEATARAFDMVVLEAVTSDALVLEACARIRAANGTLPIVILARDGATRLPGMEAGADDVFVRPLDDKELLARARNLLRARAFYGLVETQLRNADRFVALGTISASVAHEVNNPLMAVVANLSYLADSLGEHRDGVREDLLSAVREALDATASITEIVGDLRTFSRTDDAPIGAVDLRKSLETACSMARHQIQQRGAIVKAYSAAPLVRASAARLTQVFLNILINAAQALDPTRDGANEVRVSIDTAASGDAIVTITDTGTGIPAEILPRIFDPFFTTKPAGIGTGLGLSISHGIVTSLGGSIEVESAPGRGTTFRITLPVADVAPRSVRVTARMSERAAAEDVAPRAPLRVLFVDDEPRVLEAIRRMMFSIAEEWEIETAPSGERALEALARDEYTVIVSDMRMPKMDGAALLEIVQARFPRTVRVILSGQTDEGSSRRALAVAHRFLAKPCSADALFGVVNRTQSLALGDRDLEEKLLGLQTLPGQPAIRDELMACLADERASIDRVWSIVRRDPALCAKVLHVASAVTTPGAHEASVSLRAAITRIGVRTLALLAKEHGIFDSPSDAAASTAWRELCARARDDAEAAACSGARGEEAFLAALLRDVGWLALATVAPSRAATEKLRAQAGAYLLNLWGVPRRLLESIAPEVRVRSAS